MKGKICQWNDDKGFGFILPDGSSEKLFFHVSSVKTNARRPQVGDIVLFESIRDSQQRLKAKSVEIEGVNTVASTSSKKRSGQIKPPEKNAFDYFLILVCLGSLAATGFEFYRSGLIEASIPFGIPAIIAFFLLNRPKKPKDKSFLCSRCNKIAQHDSRTIKAWNNGFIRLYCGSCHLLWLKENPYNAAMNGKRSGCLGVLAFIVITPVISGISLYLWLA